MRPWNFPGRKVIRQINTGRDMSQPYTDEENARIKKAERIRSKKGRAA